MATDIQATDNAGISIDGAPAVSIGKSGTFTALPAVDVIEEVITGSATDAPVELSNTPLSRWSYFQAWVDAGELDVRYAASGGTASVVWTLDDLVVLRGKSIDGLLGRAGSSDAGDVFPTDGIILVDNPGSSSVTLKIVIGRDSTP